MTRIDTDILRDPALIAVLDALDQGGQRALIVGGAVRNALLDKPQGDIDIATDAVPQRVTELAEAAGLRTVPTGIDHGTVTVVSGGRGFEVTTFRKDVETDGRRAVVAFSDSIEDDARRRDFTMNALYARRDGTVLDPVGGLDDLAARRLRFVGQPEDRIAEDYLRILRFFRFHAWYGRQVDQAAMAACTAMAGGLARISNERIGAEMRKLLAAPDPSEAVALMQQAGVLSLILPGADAGPMQALIAAEDGRWPSWPRRLALLGADDAAAQLRLSRAEARVQDRLAEAAAADWSLNETGFRLGAALAADHVLISAARRGEPPPKGWEAAVDRADRARLPIAAADLMPDLDGPALGVALKAAEQAWIDSDFNLPRAALIDVALRAGKDRP